RHAQHTLVLVREDFHKASCRVRPTDENLSRTLASREFKVTRNQGVQQTQIVWLSDGLQVYAGTIAFLRSKVASLVEDVGYATTHAGCEISSTLTENDRDATSHIFAS